MLFLEVTCFARGGFGGDVVNGAVVDGTWELPKGTWLGTVVAPGWGQVAPERLRLGNAV